MALTSVVCPATVLNSRGQRMARRALTAVPVRVEKIRRSGIVGAIAVLAAIVLMQAPIPAFANPGLRYLGATIALDSSTQSPNSIVRDVNGNLFFTDSANGQNGTGSLVEIPYSNGAYGTPKTIVSGLNGPSGIAIDSSGNLYYGENNTSTVSKLTLSGNSYGPPVAIVTNLNGGTGATGVAVDGVGDVFVGSGSVVWKIPYSGGSYGTPAPLPSIGIQAAGGVAVDSLGNVFVSDYRTKQIFEFIYSGGSYSPPVPFGNIGSGAPVYLYVDSNRNLWYTDVGASVYQVYELPWMGSAYASSPTTTYVGSSANQEVIVDPSGNLFMIGLNPAQVREFTSDVNMGAVPVGSTSNAVSLAFSVPAGITTGAINVLDSGVQGLEFNRQSPDLSSTPCQASHAYSTGTYCQVNVTFNPTTPGIKHGAVVVLDSSTGSVLATAYMRGEGMGPEVNFLPGLMTQLPLSLRNTASAKNPIGVAVDAFNNLFYTDYANKEVAELHWTGSSYTYATGVINSGLTQPQGLAIDGAGNLYVADGTSNHIVKIIANGSGGYNGTVNLGTTLNDPKGVAVDSYGNVFVANNTGNNVVEIPWTGSAYGADQVVATLSGGYPNSITVDDSGNLFVSVFTAGKIVEIPYQNGSYGSPVTIDSGYTNPWGVATDSNGNLYAADATATGPVYEYAWNGTSFGPRTQIFTVAGGLLNMTIEGAGNFFGAGGYNVYELNRNIVPMLSFSSANVGTQSADSPQTVSVTNVGNEALSISVPGTGNNPSFPAGFAYDSGSTCPQLTTSSSAGSLARNSTCTLKVDFVPAAAGTNSGNVVLTDNNLGVANSVQNFQVSGTGLQTQIIFPPVSTGTPGTPQTVNVTIPNGKTVASVMVVTQGVQNLDFTADQSTTCAAGSSGSCNVVVDFTPKAPGLRLGAAIVTLNDGTTLTTYVSGIGQGPVLQFQPGAMSTVAGNGQHCLGTTGASCGDGTNPLAASFTHANTVIYDAAGNAFVADLGASVVREITVAGVVSTVAGQENQLCSTPAAQTCGDGGPATSALLNGPSDITIDGAGNLYIADKGDNRVRVVSLITGKINAFAGSGTLCTNPTGAGSCGDGGLALNAKMGSIDGMAVDAQGNVYIGDTDDHEIREVMQNTGNITTIAGNGTLCSPATNACGDGGQATASQVNYPNKIRLDSQGNIYVADSSANRVREINVSTGVISSVAGNGSKCSSPTSACGDGGPATSAQMSTVWGLALDGADNLYVVDNDDSKIRFVNHTTGIISTVVGNGQICASPFLPCGDGGNGTQAELDYPVCVAFNPQGNIDVCDANDYRIRQLSFDASSLSFAPTNVGSKSTDSPQPITIVNAGNAPLSFSVPATGNNPSISAGFAIDNTSINSACPVVSTSGPAANLAVGGSCSIGIDFMPTQAGTNSGSLVLTDNNFGMTSQTQTVSLAGTGIQTVTQLVFTTPPAPGILVGGNAGSAITVSEENASNSVVTSATDTITLTVTGPNGYSQAYTQAAVAGVAKFNLSAAMLATPGLYTYTASFNAMTAMAPEQVAASSYITPTQNVGLPSSTQTATILLGSDFTLGSISVVTEGVTGQDFVEASGGTCATGTAYTMGQTCTVSYTFTPTVPGERLGAILLYDSSGNLVSTTYLSGKGVAPEAIVSYPQNGVVVATHGQTLGTVTINDLGDATIDGAGNIYAVDTGTSSLYKFTKTGAGAYTGSVVSLTGASLYQPALLTIDGAGVLYTAAGVNVQKIVNGVVANVSLGNFSLGSYARGIAVDASGNLYVSDASNNRIIVVPSSGSSPYLLPNFPAADMPGSLAVDPSGTVIYYELNSHSIKSLTAAGAVATVYTPPANTQIYQLNLDVNGNVQWGDEYFGGYHSVSQTGTVNTLPVSNGCGTHTFLQAGNGDYVASSSSCGNLIVYSGSTSSSLGFKPTVTGTTSSDSPQTATLYNMGNAALNIAVPGSGSNPSISSGFALSSSSTCSTVGTSGPAATVAAGSSCTLAVNFSPTTVGSNSGSLVVTDDSLNMSGSTQTISLAGTGLPPVTALGFGNAPASPVVVGGNASVVTVDELNSSNAVVTTAGDLITLTVAGPNGYSKTYTAIAVAGVATFNLSGAALTTPGAYTYTATGATFTAVSTETVTKATPAITVAAAPSPVFVGSTVTYTATVTGTAPTAPTGSVTFYSGTTMLGTATLSSSGVAVITATPSVVGTYVVKAAYSGDSEYLTATANAVTQLQAQDFSLAVAGGGTNTMSVLPGGTATFNLVINPLGGTTFPSTITLTQTGGPSGVTITLSPTTINAGAGSTNLTLTAVVPNAPLAVNQKPDALGSKLAPLTLAFLLLPLMGFRRFRKQWLRSLAVIVLLAGGLVALTGLTGCTKASGYFGQSPTSYTITVTGTSGSLTHSTSVTLNVE